MNYPQGVEENFIITFKVSPPWPMRACPVPMSEIGTGGVPTVSVGTGWLVHQKFYRKVISKHQ